MHWDDPNKPTRHRLPRADDPRHFGPVDSGDPMRDGYRVLSRRPRVAGYDDLVSPEKAERIETIVFGYEDMMVSDE